MHQFIFILCTFIQCCEAAVCCGVVKLHSNCFRVATESGLISVFSGGEVDDKESINEALCSISAV